MIKPILKWVGGKTKILSNLLSKFPTNINNYHEPFVGGGSVLFGVLSSNINITGEIFAYDINESLINMYKNIQSNHIELYDIILEIINKYKSAENKEEYYYKIRKIYNETENNTIHNSAMFIFLNKTCFRGLYRVGPHGFNVPYGNYKNPAILELSHLELVASLIEKVNFVCLDFSEALQCIDNDDFVYLDPPYVPEKPNSFVKYTINGFNLEQHELLFKLCKQLPKFVMSNSNSKLIHEYFTDIEYIECRRAINSKKPESKTTEVIIKNY